jgi:hypothetical protein
MLLRGHVSSAVARTAVLLDASKRAAEEVIDLRNVTTKLGQMLAGDILCMYYKLYVSGPFCFPPIAL